MIARSARRICVDDGSGDDVAVGSGKFGVDVGSEVCVDFDVAVGVGVGVEVWVWEVGVAVGVGVGVEVWVWEVGVAVGVGVGVEVSAGGSTAKAAVKEPSVETALNW
jgi:hypothetical protein